MGLSGPLGRNQEESEPRRGDRLVFNRQTRDKCRIRGRCRPDGGYITVDTGSSATRSGGDELHVLQLVTSTGPFFQEQLRVLEQNGVACTVLTVPKSGSDGRSIRDYTAFYGKVLRVATREDFDLVHANYGLTAPMAMAQPTRPIVLSLWGSDLFGPYGYVSKACAKAINEVIVMSEEMAAEMEGDPSVIPHGVDLERFQPHPAQKARERVGWDHNCRHVLFPWGTDRVEKDFPRAAWVVENARDQLSEPVELHPVSGVPHEKMPVYMNAADVLLMTSKWEGSPNSVREALACNLPVVATDVGDVSEHIGALPLSQVCQTDDELVGALVTALESQRTPRGREQARDLGLEQMGEDLLDVYHDALSR